MDALTRLNGAMLPFAKLLGLALPDASPAPASRPRAITMRPIRGWLWRASKVRHAPPK